MSKVMVSPSWRVALGFPMVTFAVTLAIRRPLAHRAQLELIAGDGGKGRRDPLLGDRDLEESAAPLLIGDVVGVRQFLVPGGIALVHSPFTVSCPPAYNRAIRAENGRITACCCPWSH